MTYITSLTGRRSVYRDRLLTMILAGCALLLLQSSVVQAQWSAPATNINNTNSGTVSIGTTNPGGDKLITAGNILGGNITSHTQLYPGHDSHNNVIMELGYGTATANITPLASLVLSKNLTSANNPVGALSFANSSIANGNEKRIGQISSWTEGATNSGTLRFLTSSANVLNEVMRITSGGNVGIGTTTPLYSLDVNGGTNGFRAKAASASSSDTIATFENSSGIQAIIRANGNVGIGTIAPAAKLEVSSSANTALYVQSTGANSIAQIKLTGRTNSVDKFWYMSSRGGYDTPVNRLSFFDSGTVERVTFLDGGNVGIGITAPSATLHVQGTGRITGNLTVDGNIAAKYQDVAEWVQSSQQLSAGTVVVLDHTKSNQVIASSQAYDTRVAGVISLQPGITLGENGAGKVLVATTGRVKVKVDATAGPIQVGDLLVTSDKEGVARKSEPLSLGGVAIHRPGTLIGKALEPLEKGAGEILVLLSLQ